MICDKLDMDEVRFFYKSPHSLVDFTVVQSFTLIKSCIEILSYYGITDFTSADIKDLFSELDLVQKKNGRKFVPSPKKVNSVLECYLNDGKNSLSLNNGIYHIVSWDHSGYGFEIDSARRSGRL